MVKTVIFQPAEVKQAAKLIQAGQLVGLSRKPVYGVWADETDEGAVKAV